MLRKNSSNFLIKNLNNSPKMASMLYLGRILFSTLCICVMSLAIPAMYWFTTTRSPSPRACPTQLCSSPCPNSQLYYKCVMLMWVVALTFSEHLLKFLYYPILVVLQVILKFLKLRLNMLQVSLTHIQHNLLLNVGGSHLTQNICKSQWVLIVCHSYNIYISV